jgi:hypothetical protein
MTRGAFAADTWMGLNAAHFDGALRYHGGVWGGPHIAVLTTQNQS